MNLNITSAVTTIEDMEQEALFDTLHTSLEELDLIMISAEAPELSEESLHDMLKSISTVFGKMMRSFSSIMANAHKTYKTEYSTWSRQNKKMIQAVNGLDTNIISSVMVDYPSGMTLSYFEVTELLANFFTSFKSSARLDQFGSAIDSMLSSISNESDGHEQTIKVANTTSQSITKKLVSIHEAILNGFDSSTAASSKKPFEELFPEANDLTRVNNQLVVMNKHIADEKTILKQCNDITETLSTCVDFITDRTNGKTEGTYMPSKEFIATLAEFIKSLDNMFIMYGDATIRSLAIFHNITFVYKALDAKKVGS